MYYFVNIKNEMIIIEIPEKCNYSLFILIKKEICQSISLTVSSILFRRDRFLSFFVIKFSGIHGPLSF